MIETRFNHSAYCILLRCIYVYIGYREYIVALSIVIGQDPPFGAREEKEDSNHVCSNEGTSLAINT